MNIDAGANGYVLGHSDAELLRLRRQADVYADFTESVLASAGLGSGMSVLDVGCGIGDVSMAAARLVGPKGRVHGIDRSADALDVARTRAAMDGLDQIAFEQADLADADDRRYDAVIGRFILLHQADPDGVLRSLAGRVRPGGVIAFIEMDLGTAAVVPPMPLFDQALGWIGAVYARDGFHADMGSRLYRAFRAAGLEPSLAATVRVEGGPDAFACEYIAETVRSMLPRIEALGIADAGTVQAGTLAERIREAAIAGDHCFFYPRMVGAYTRVPG